MAFDFYMPDIGEGVVEGEIVAWRVKEGDRVQLDQPLVEVMTDKATVELPSPRAGTIVKIHYRDGQICPVGKVLVVIDDEAGTTTAASARPPSGNGQPAATAATAGAAAGPVALAAPAAAEPAAIEVVDASAQRARVLATPATGKHGRVTADDVRRYQGDGGDAPAAPAASHQPAASAQARAAAHPPLAIPKPAAGYEEERIPLRGVRKRIAEAMARAVHTSAHFTYVEEIDMTELVAVRERAKARAAERGVKLNYLPFIVKAIVSGLKKWPALNAS